MRNRICGTCRGHLVQLCPLRREGSQGPRFSGRYSKSDSPRSTSSPSKCRWRCPWQGKACWAGHWFCGAERGFPPGPSLHHLGEPALPSAFRITSGLRKRRLRSLLARILGADAVLALTLQGLLPCSCVPFPSLSLSSSKRLLCWFLFC